MSISYNDPRAQKSLPQKRPVYIREIEIRYKKKKVKSDSPIGQSLVNPEVVVELFSDLQNEAKEKLITISVDVKLKIICFEVVAVGSVSSIYARPIEAIRAAIPLNPYGIIVVHNHTSGDPAPSVEDEKFTSDLLINTKSLGLEFHDHIIIGHDSYFSFAEQGLMQKLKRELEKKL
jgi:DNA repair protein RadC